MQKIYSSLERLLDVLRECKPQKTLLVCDSAFEHLSFNTYITKTIGSYALFNGFTSNPLYEDVVNGVQLFNEQGCDLILAVGGGSAMDVAKCIKLYSERNVPLVAVPTTAGTGSESTRFAVIYKDGEKQSVSHDSILPDYVILEHYALRSLPIYQKKCTVLDALCQAIESFWSVNSTDESKPISSQAIKLIKEAIPDYIKGTDTGNENMLHASNLAGQAINITQTTAAHAMSYKLTSLYDIPHGHAAALCLPAVWQFMLENMDKCTDPRGTQYVSNIFSEIATALDFDTPIKAIGWFEELLVDLQITIPEKVSFADTLVLAGSVNPTRLKNNPVSIDYDAAKALYTQILKLKSSG